MNKDKNGVFELQCKETNEQLHKQCNGQTFVQLAELWERICSHLPMSSLKQLCLVSQQLRSISYQDLWHAPMFKCQLHPHDLVQLVHLPVRVLYTSTLNFQEDVHGLRYRMHDERILKFLVIFKQMPWLRGVYLDGCHCRQRNRQRFYCYEHYQKVSLRQLVYFKPFLLRVCMKAILFDVHANMTRQVTKLCKILMALPKLESVIVDGDQSMSSLSSGLHMACFTYKHLKLLSQLPVREVHLSAVKFLYTTAFDNIGEDTLIPEIAILHQMEHLHSIVVNDQLSIAQLNQMKSLPITHVFLPNLIYGKRGESWEHRVETLFSFKETLVAAYVCMDFCYHERSSLAEFKSEDLSLLCTLPIRKIMTQHFDMTGRNLSTYIRAVSPLVLTTLHELIIDSLYCDEYTEEKYSLVDIRSMRHLPITSFDFDAIEIDSNIDIEHYKREFQSMRKLSTVFKRAHEYEEVNEILSVLPDSVEVI